MIAHFEEPDDLTLTVQELVSDTTMGRPHIVIIGAGASVAALQNGDSNGKTLPVMDNLVEVVGLKPVLERNGIEYEGKNFEAVYSELYEKSAYQETIRVIESQIRAYFRELKLPPYPTIYDHLVLSLREKDLIASFNWDRFLYQIVFYPGGYLPGLCYSPRSFPAGRLPPDLEWALLPEIPPGFVSFPIEQDYGSVALYYTSHWHAMKRGVY